jgi:hypothetical protein
VSALGLSLAIVKPPVVAVGAGILQGEKLLIGGSLVGVIGIAGISAWTQRRRKQTSD